MADIKQNPEEALSGCKTDDDEISLIDLFAVLWRRRAMILAITLVAAIGVTAFSVVSLALPPETSPLPNEYTPKAAMLINNASSSGGGLSSMLASSGLSGLASLAGVGVPGGSTFSELAVYLVGSNTLLDAVADEFGLIERYKIEKFPRASSREILKKNLSAEYDAKSGVFSISFKDTDPAFAQRVVNYCVTYLDARFNDLGVDKNKLQKENLERNIETSYREIISLEGQARTLEQSVRGGGADIPSISLAMNRMALELGAQKQVYTQLKVQYELLKVTMASESPVFQILEMAEVPDRKSGPSRGLICIVAVLAAGFLAVFLAFVLNAAEHIRQDPEAMAKLKGKRG
ncbi:MAG: lipopolysaccharide biosynthesis protein [Treponema sp.]|jgi:uncharacterized protein involved in exopolysaccharide biosynthesis|nr:lipopolysaccharide biosynthesis protein [Treponema sp.]